jgi:cation transport ATPase
LSKIIAEKTREDSLSISVDNTVMGCVTITDAIKGQRSRQELMRQGIEVIMLYGR